MSDLHDNKKEKKARKPVFLRQETHKKKRLSKKWRKPRGGDSKLRLRMQGRVIVSPGYGTPKNLRGMHGNLEIVHVSRMSEISSLDPKKHCAVISGRIGQRTRFAVIEALLKENITILNIKDPAGYVEDKKSKLEKKKTKKQEKATKETTEKKKSDKESIEDKLSDEEKKKIEKKDIDKLLTKRT